ncbi:MAG: divergent polysaccharide deacetylase family protein [Candidatus Omnitrophota bacterium]
MKARFIIGLLLAIIALQAVFLFRCAGGKDNTSGEIKARSKKIEPVSSPSIKKEYKYKVAIIIDDWGYSLNNMALLEKILQPLTLAVLPNLPYSREVSLRAQGLNKEVILHLPLEPYKSKELGLEQNTIMTAMSEQKMASILNDDLDGLIDAQGASNHMGSKFTRDKKAVGVIFKVLKQRGLFFVDSLTSRSVCRKVARQSGVSFVARDVFLDNKLDAEYIERQLQRLIKKAKSRGWAVGIGHDRRITLETLQRMLPQIEKDEEGLGFVFVRELVE